MGSPLRCLSRAYRLRKISVINQPADKPEAISKPPEYPLSSSLITYVLTEMNYVYARMPG